MAAADWRRSLSHYARIQRREQLASVRWNEFLATRSAWKHARGPWHAHDRGYWAAAVTRPSPATLANAAACAAYFGCFALRFARDESAATTIAIKTTTIAPTVPECMPVSLMD